MAIVSRYEIHRGRQNELDKTGTGTATITLIDTNGSLDPASGALDYDPGTPVAIALTNPVTLASEPIFTGNVSRWGYKPYPNLEYGVATVECVDGMAVLAAAEMTPDIYGDPADLGALGDIQYDVDDQVKHRIDHVLDDAGFGLTREIFTGNVQLQKTVYSLRQPALNVITDAADAEFPTVANFYFQKDGRPTFHGRLARFNPTEPTYHITTWNCGDVANSSGRAVIFDLDYDRDVERIYNSALATPEGIADADIEDQRIEDSGSVIAHGTRSWSAENLVIQHSWLTGNNAVDECRDVYAQYMINNFSQPETRVNRITFRTVAPTHAWAAATWALICGIDISDRIHLQTANGFNGHHFVEGLHYTVLPASDDYLDVTLDVDVSPAAYWTSLPS